ncbi:UvrB/UvrC motif-containing protein [Sphingomonas donggukensis]|uniref:UvrB/UvrC motif-containing protein n=1 Tax=Sphingomonas donggukensis TaxID=2949093 RepID=A0ABY4TTR7_9SPHN|nr:UvrB/UvrC motif-containing protein [Sphingomonas donggukensis]URW75667.1 UvrB/UvrC motif-containing protein [Sphingomonas donggukensis]
MTDPIADLQRRMNAAAAALDFETASRLRDELSILRTAGGDSAEAIDTAGLTRQQPGAMGLGTSQQRMEPPTGWVKPKKPDPMTRGRSRRR